jgi:HlyD family secretion protein
MSQKDKYTGPQKAAPFFFRKPVFLSLGGIVFAGLGFWFFAGLTTTAPDAGQFYQVRRGNMLISITEGGTLRAATEVSIVSQLEGQARIIYIIPEGTHAEAGDLLVELDASDLEENLTQRQIAYQNALSSFTEASENLAIKKSEVESEIKLAELKVEFAHIDRAKYIEGDWPQQKNNATSEITVAEIELRRARERADQTKQLEARGYATRSELETDELSVTRRQLELSRAEEALRLLTKYQNPRRIRELDSDLEQAEEALNRARSRAAAQLTQAEATLKAREATLDLEKSRLDRVTNQLRHTRIYAPQAGLVVYSTASQGGQQSPMEEGATVRQRQEIIKLPDLSRMPVEVKVHESQVSQVRRGQTAFVTIDSIPDRQFRGRIQRVAVLPDSQSRWLNPDLKVYTTEVLIEEELPEINPGVSARAEILVSQLQDVIQVPIQAVSTVDGQRVVNRSSGNRVEAVPVEIGLFNDSFVQVRSGLVDGDRILLAAPRRGAGSSGRELSPAEESETEEAAALAPVASPGATAATAEVPESSSGPRRGEGGRGGRQRPESASSQE